MEYRLIFNPTADVDTVLFLLLEYGFEGSYEEVPIDVFQTEDGYGYREKHDDPITIVTFSQQVIENEQWEEWFGKFGWKKASAKKAALQTGEEWKETFSLIQVSPGIQLIPEWMRDDACGKAKFSIFMEPGAAFGTGLHATTQDCMRLMETLPLRGKRVLDIGSGSGILSILAKMMGARQVIAMDLNPSAKLELQKNMVYNGIEEGIECVIGDVFALELPRVDVAFCNIGLKEDIQLLPALLNCLEENGFVIASGIVEWGEQQLIDQYSKHGFKLSDRRQTQEWVTCLFTKYKKPS